MNKTQKKEKHVEDLNRLLPVVKLAIIHVWDTLPSNRDAEHSFNKGNGWLGPPILFSVATNERVISFCEYSGEKV